MASTSKYAPRKSNVDNKKITLNYEAVKRSYFEQIEQNKDLLKANLCTRQGIEEKIRQITIDKIIVANMIVENVDGRNKLFLKKNEWSSLEVLPVEDAFDIVLDIHVACDHGNAATTYEKVINTYSVPIFCVCWLVASCNVCSATAKGGSTENQNEPVQVKSIEKVLNNPIKRGIWRLNIIEHDLLVKNTRSSASYLLILKEDSTNFVLLRPLFESSEELGLELMKLFSEFGYPEKVFVPNILAFYKKIFLLVSAINRNTQVVPVEEAATNVAIFKKDKDEVLKEIQNWMEMMHDTYWEQCCHIVQYKLNTTEKPITRLFNKEEVYGIPFNMFFNYQFRTKITWFDPPFYKKSV